MIIIISFSVKIGFLFFFLILLMAIRIFFFHFFGSIALRSSIHHSIFAMCLNPNLKNYRTRSKIVWGLIEQMERNFCRFNLKIRTLEKNQNLGENIRNYDVLQNCSVSRRMQLVLGDAYLSIRIGPTTRDGNGNPTAPPPPVQSTCNTSKSTRNLRGKKILIKYSFQFYIPNFS